MSTPTSPRRQLAWYQVPVVWLGLLIFAASMAGCVWIIMASMEYRDHALPVPAQSVFGVPAHADPPAGSSSR